MWRTGGLRTLAVLFVVVCGAVPGAAQSDPYLAAVAEHFEVPRAEMGILAEWSVPADEIPVVLFVAARGGASRDALLALRRRGTPWLTIAGRYGLHAGNFHYPISTPPDSGPLQGAYAAFAETPSARWSEVQLDDRAVILLVNLRFLAEHLDLEAVRVAEALVATGSGTAALARLDGGRR